MKAGAGGTNVLAIIGNWKPSALEELSKSLQKINANNKYKFNFEANGDVLSCYLSKVGNTNRTRIADISDTGILKFNGKDHPFGSVYTYKQDGKEVFVRIEKKNGALEFTEIKNKDEALSLQKTSNREEMALKVEEECFYCAQIIRKAGSVRTNLFASLTDKTRLNKFKEYYKNNETLYAELNKLSEASTINRTKLEELFKNYQAHHVIPVNVIKDSENLQELLAHAQKRGLNFEFNNFDNLIFLHKENHLGPHGEYDKQIREIIEGLDMNNLDDAVDDLVGKIDKIRSFFSKEVIGKNIKIDKLNYDV